MLILFDKNVPAPLRRFLTSHHIETAAQRGWGELENGELLSAAEKIGFDLMITADQNIKYQQNLATRKIALVVLGSNRWPLVMLHAQSVAAAINRAKPGSFEFVEIGAT